MADGATDAIANEWSVLLAHEREPLRSVIARAEREPSLRAKFPFLSHDNLRFSSTVEYPFDWDLPYVVVTPLGELQARNGDNSIIAVGDLDTVVQLVASAMARR